jgi:hypothetical protein
MNLEEQTPTTDNTPRPFMEIPGLWMQLGQMTESFFAKEVSRVSNANTFYGVLLFTFVSTVVSVIQSLLGGLIDPSINSPDGLQTGLMSKTGFSILYLFCFGIFLIPISFYLNNAITFLCAKIFGGKGSFSSQAYLSSLFIVPLGIISSVASLIILIPIVGSCIGGLIVFGILIAQLIFTVRALKAVHGFTTGRAVSAILLPLIVFLVIPVCLIAILALMGPQIGNVFSNILTEIGTPVP